MTQNGLEYDRKKFTPTNVNAGTCPKDSTDEAILSQKLEFLSQSTEVLEIRHLKIQSFLSLRQARCNII